MNKNGIQSMTISYIQFLFEKSFELKKIYIYFSKKIINSGNYIYDYDYPVFIKKKQVNKEVKNEDHVNT